MSFMNNGRVNIVITNRVLRYSYHKNTSIDSMVTHGEVELPEGTMKDGVISNKAVFEEIVHKLVRENKWRRKKLCFSVPDDTVVIRQLQIPATLTKEEAVGYIHTQVGNSFYLPFSDPAIAIDLLDVDEKHRNILLYAYPKEKISSFKESFEENGLKSVVADLTALSVYRYYYQQKQEDKENVLLIHWNQEALILTAFQHHKAIFNRYMKTSEEQGELTKESANHLIQEYMVEINRIINFYQFSITKGKSSIDLLLLSGDFQYLSDVKQTLTETISIPIHQFPEEKLAAKFTDVLGLAIKKEG